MNPINLFTPKIDVWDPKQNLAFPGFGVVGLMLLIVYGISYVTMPPPQRGGTVSSNTSRRSYRTKFGESSTHIMPHDVLSSLLWIRSGRGATQPPLLKDGPH